jgi:hypothetical protein
MGDKLKPCPLCGDKAFLRYVPALKKEIERLRSLEPCLTCGVTKYAHPFKLNEFCREFKGGAFD